MEKYKRIILLLRRPGIKEAYLYTTDIIKKHCNFEYVFELSLLSDLTKWGGVEKILIPYNFALLNNITARKDFLIDNPKAEIIRFYNEYSLSESGDIKKVLQQREYDFIINFEAPEKYFNSRGKVRNVYQVNINPFSYFGDYSKGKHDLDIIYYGGFRLDRKEYFDKYFDRYLYLATPKKNIPKWNNLLTNKPLYIEPINLRTHLNRFRYSLYIEDKWIHSHYHNPANRFYEALMSGVVLLFDENCKNTFDKYGLDISDFIVSSKQDIIKRLNKKCYQKDIDKQKQWIKRAIEEKEFAIKELQRILQ